MENESELAKRAHKAITDLDALIRAGRQVIADAAEIAEKLDQAKRKEKNQDGKDEQNQPG